MANDADLTGKRSRGSFSPMSQLTFLAVGLFLLRGGAVSALGAELDYPKPLSRSVREVAGWSVRVDDRLLRPPDEALGTRALKLLEAKLADITYVVPEERLRRLQTVPIVVDLTHGRLRGEQPRQKPGKPVLGSAVACGP